MYIAKARIRTRQQIYRPESMAVQNGNGNVIGHRAQLFHHSQHVARLPTSGGQPLVA